jgi:8-oxo-dGTP pyrophosphatase MutT (NUDIX family)
LIKDIIGLIKYQQEKETDLLTKDSRQFVRQVTETLEKWNRDACLYSENLIDPVGSSAVLCLFSECQKENGPGTELCFVFNKRSKWVRQAGDLCFPGGGIHHRFDSLVARFLGLPFFPLGRWPHWKQWKVQRRKESDLLALLLATGLRECFEEMRLNPFRTRFLGPMPPQALASFQRFLYPMAVWIRPQKRFFPNREVEKVVSIPLNDFLKPEKYVRFRMRFQSYLDGEEMVQDFPGFLHEDGEESEVLWGVTYRIVMTFLEILLDFQPPDMDTLPVVEGMRDENYLNSRSKKPTKSELEKEETDWRN